MMVTIQSVAESGWEMVKKSGAPILATLSAATVTAKKLTDNPTFDTPLGTIDLCSESSELAATVTSLGAAYFAVREKCPRIADCSAAIGITGTLYQQGHLNTLIEVVRSTVNSSPHIVISAAGITLLGGIAYLGRKTGMEMEAKEHRHAVIHQNNADENEDIENPTKQKPQNRIHEKKLGFAQKNKVPQSFSTSSCEPDTIDLTFNNRRSGTVIPGPLKKRPTLETRQIGSKNQTPEVIQEVPKDSDLEKAKQAIFTGNENLRPLYARPIPGTKRMDLKNQTPEVTVVVSGDLNLKKSNRAISSSNENQTPEVTVVYETQNLKKTKQTEFSEEKNLDIQNPGNLNESPISANSKPKQMDSKNQILEDLTETILGNEQTQNTKEENTNAENEVVSLG